MDATSGRDAQWFEATYLAHEHELRRYVARRVGVDAADDIVAEAFTTLWRRRNDAPERVLPWLYGVAANHLAHWTRSQARRDRLDGRLRASALSGDWTPELPDPGIAQVLAQLPADQAEILRLAHWEGLEPRDIAVVLGCTANAARVRLHRARQLAAQLLGQAEDAL